MMLMSFGVKKASGDRNIRKSTRHKLKIILELLKVKVWLSALMKALIKPLSYAYLFQI